MWHAVPMLALSLGCAPGPIVMRLQPGMEHRNPARSATTRTTLGGNSARLAMCDHALHAIYPARRRRAGGVWRARYGRRYFPVWLASTAATSSGVPVATIWPPE